MNVFSTLSSVVNFRLLGSAVLLVTLVILVGYLSEKNKRVRDRKKSGLLRYTVPGKTMSGCRSLLGAPSPDDLFAYTLEATTQGGWHLHLLQHQPTGQLLDTLYLLTFNGDEPAQFSLHFIREAFGQKEPIVPEALLDAFFAAKLGAVRLPNPPIA